MEAERDKNKLDPWKVKHFEPIWGEKREPKLRSGLHCINESRSSGAVTRSSLRLRLENNIDTITSENTHCPIVLSEDKIEEDSCKIDINTNNTEDINDAQEEQANLLSTEYNESIHTDSVEIAVSTQLCQERIDDAIHVNDVTEETPKNNEIENQICQEKNVDTYMEEEVQENHKEVEVDVKDHLLEVAEENTGTLLEDNSSSKSNEQSEHVSLEEPNSQLPKECTPETSVDQISQISKEQITQISDDQIYQITDCETSTALGNSPTHSQVRTSDIVMDESNLMVNNTQSESGPVSHENSADGESQIPEGMEIDSETLQRIHELEVRSKCEIFLKCSLLLCDNIYV